MLSGELPLHALRNALIAARFKILDASSLVVGFEGSDLHRSWRVSRRYS